MKKKRGHCITEMSATIYPIANHYQKSWGRRETSTWPLCWMPTVVRGWGRGSAVPCWPSRCKALGSTPRTTRMGQQPPNHALCVRMATGGTPTWKQYLVSVLKELHLEEQVWDQGRVAHSKFVFKCSCPLGLWLSASGHFAPREGL